jgi:hypothetical protein
VDSVGKICALPAVGGIVGGSMSWAVCVEVMMEPSGSVTGIPFVTAVTLVHGVSCVR